MRGLGGIKLLEPYLLDDLVKSEQMYSGVFPLRTLNTITALLYFGCFDNGRSLRVFSLQSIGIDGSEREKKKEFCCATIKRNPFFWFCFFVFLDGLHCNHPTEWRHSLIRYNMPTIEQLAFFNIYIVPGLIK